MTHKKKQQFVAPAIRVVKMHSECTIMATSEALEEYGKSKTEGLTPEVSLDWSTGGKL